MQQRPYDLSGAFSVTICTLHRQNILGDIQGATVQHSEIGNIVASEWEAIPLRFPNITLDEYVVMPNHLHGILHNSPQSALPSLGTVIGAYKSLKVRNISQRVGQDGCKIWQRNYYEQIIRSKTMLENIRHYIRENPSNWPDDPENTPLL